MEKGYEERKQRRADFLTRYSPGDDVAKLTERMLLADYCAERFRYARDHLRQILIEKRTDWKQEMAGYEALLPEVNALFSDEVITSAHFRLLYHLNFYLQYRRYAVGDDSFTDMDLVDEQQGNMLSQFLLANMLGNSLVHNDTVDFTTARPKYDALVQVPVLRHAVDLLYRRTMEYLQHPEDYSHYLLYGTPALADRQASGKGGLYRLLGSSLSSLSGRDRTDEEVACAIQYGRCSHNQYLW